MAFASVNGVPLDVEYGTWKEERLHLGDFGDLALSGRPPESRTGFVRKWSGRLTTLGSITTGSTPTHDAVNLAKLIRWIEGQGQVWAFDSAVHARSGLGVTASVSGTYTPYSSGGFIGGRLNVGSGSYFGVALQTRLGVPRGWAPSMGWTLICHKNFQSGESASAGWHSVILTGATTFSRGSAANPTGVTQYVDGVAGSYSLGRCFSVLETSPYVGLHGYLTTNSAAAVDFDNLAFYPFIIPTPWIGTVGAGADDGLAAFVDTFAIPPSPIVALGGFAIEPQYGADVVHVIGRVKGSLATQVIQAGAVLRNLPQIDVEFLEWGG